ncbi:hypothetical protein HSTV2_47 [Halorubrum sodomense tailed virus 2]|uniref:Uncharacterized protein n=1 Tax=Halorubrum sodomense tailed virus 2 TaxID=1262527 RepID=L7THK2_9CAUD|nr:hypothetical protein HSTV2_47 [Halorubrum sodomense tailed virus 2]AGC34316.1 hypothetical protein HSTV2_47 [Halorubrum sodomense tailed virus 2]
MSNIEINDADSTALLSLLDLCIEADRPKTAFYLDDESIERVEELRSVIAEQVSDEAAEVVA